MEKVHNSSSSPKEVGVTVATKSCNPNPTSRGIGVEASKERMVDCVHKRIGNLKEVLNVIMNQSCQEVSSQMIQDSSKAIENTRATKNNSSS